MGRHSALPTVSAQGRLLILAGMFGSAIVMTIVVAAFFVSRGSSHDTDPSSTAGVVGAAGPGVPTTTPSARSRSTSAPRPTSPSPARRTPSSTPRPTDAAALSGDRPVVAFRPTSTWDDGFVSAVVLTNTTDAPLRWELSFELEDAEITEIWRADLDESDSGATVARGLDYNALIQPGEQVEFGFRADGSDWPRVRGCELNGARCQVTHDG